MQTMMLPVLLLLAIRPCLGAVTWKKVGCDGWTYDGVGIEDIWDNAVAMAVKAQTQIDAVPTEGLRFTDEQKNAGANAEFMWGGSFRKLFGGLNSKGQAGITEARAEFVKIQQGFEGTLENLDVNNAYIICGGDGLINGRIPNFNPPTSIWHGELDTTITVTNDEGVEEEQPAKEYITFDYVTASYRWRPCYEINTETTEPENDPVYMGKTFTAFQTINDVTQRFVGIILCPDQKKWTRDPVTKKLIDDVTLVGTLAENFIAEPKSGQKYAYIADYNALSGTLLHEMAHVVGRMEDEESKWEDKAYGFKSCMDLAKKTQSDALINPDNYRLFAQMSMAPTAEWGMKKG